MASGRLVLVPTESSASMIQSSIYEAPPPLDKQEALSKDLVVLLRSVPNSNVAISDIESRLGFKWKSFLYQDPCLDTPFNLRDDPFFAQMIHARIIESIETFVFAISNQLASLPGLHASQSFHLVQSQIGVVQRVVSSKLTPVICGSTSFASYSQLETALDECSRLTSEKSIESLKSLLRQQVSGLHALKALQSKAQSNQSFTHILFEKADEFDCLATYPPRQLLRLFSHEGACFEELAEFLISGNRRGVTGAAGLEPSGSVKEIGIYLWMKRNPVVFDSPQFDQLINSIDVCACLAPDDDAWHGVLVCELNDDNPVRVPMPPLTHCYGTEDMWISSVAHQTAEIDCALLSTRIMHALRSLVRRQVLGVQCVKSELLLASASRFRLRCKMARSAEESAPVDEENDESEEAEEDELAEPGPALFDRSEVVSMLPSLPSLPSLVARDAPKRVVHTNLIPLKTMCKLKTVHVDVPICLERDFAVLENIKYFLEQENAKPREALMGLFIIKIQTVAERIVSFSKYLKAESTAAASQWTSVVCSKLVLRIPETIELYKRGEKWMHKPLTKPMCACIIGRRDEIDPILEDLSCIARRMQYDKSFSDVWFSSRFSKNRQKRKRFEQKHGESASVSDFGMMVSGLVAR